MSTIPFTPKNDQKQPDLVPKIGLLRRFSAQIAPLLPDQIDLYTASLAPTLVQQVIFDLYMRHISIKTNETLEANAQLDFIFHNFDPASKVEPAIPSPTTFTEILNLIQYGHPVTVPAEKTNSILPAAFWDLSEVSDRIAALLAQQVLNLCGAISYYLKPQVDPAVTDADPDQPITFLARRTAEALIDFLPKDTSELAEPPAGVDTEELKS